MEVLVALVTPRTLACQVLSLGDFPGKSTGVGCHSLLQEIFPTQRLNSVSYIAGRFFTI